jgi:hypothetical protein
VAVEAIRAVVTNQLAKVGERGTYNDEICFDVTTQRVLSLDTFIGLLLDQICVITHMKTLARASLYEKSGVVTKGHKVAKRRMLVMMVLDHDKY